MRWTVSILTGLAFLLLGANQSANEHGEGKSTHHSGHWGYAENGPAAWGDLSPKFQTCKTGHQQSPIDIQRPSESGLAQLTFDYTPAPLHILNNGHTIQVNIQPGSQVQSDMHEFWLAQFHFHSPSEHTVNGKAYPMEIHFVHKNVDGELGVVGVLVEEGLHNSVLSDIWDHWPEEAGKKVGVADTEINPGDLLPKNRGYYRYMGSLTTPPCSEGVHWYVLNEPIQASASQIGAFLALIHENARPVQAQHGRFLIRSDVDSEAKVSDSAEQGHTPTGGGHAPAGDSHAPAAHGH